MCWRKILVLCFLCTSLRSQEFRASLSGRVTDQSAGAVALADVSVRSKATGDVLRAATDQDGRYQVPFLNPGDYTVTVEKAGFRKSVQEGLTLQVAERSTLDVQLTVGEVTQSLTVEANAGLIETENADRGLTIDSKRVEATPLQGRNIIAIAWTTPGVAVTGSVTRLRPFDTGGSSGMSINGSRPSMNEVLIDGVSNLSKASSVAYIPPVEATDEFRVQTTNYDAQYGWTTGGVVNILTKSGSNDWHGNLFEFFQNTHLNANTFENNRNGVRRSSSHINTFGGYLGGAVKKNKLFFLGSYENLRQVIPDPFVTSVPTAAQRTGDFSQTFYAAANGVNQLQVIYDPYTTRLVNGAYVRDAFPGNVIPPNRINPIAAKVLSLIPLGNTRGNAITGLNNLATAGDSRKFTDFFPSYTGRVDYNVNESTRMFVRYSRNALAEQRSFRYSTNSNLNIAETGNNSPFTRENHSATIQLTKILNPATVLDVRLGLARFRSQSGSAIGLGGISGLGFSSQYLGLASTYFPRFSWANYEGAGATPSYVDPTAQTNSFQSSLVKIVSRHSLKLGGELRIQRAYGKNQGFSAGSFNFTQQFTGSSPTSVSANSGNAIASFLLGVPQDGFIDVNSEPARQQRLFSLYVNDDLRVTQKLKLNLGVRWDYLGPLTDRFNALTTGFDTTSSFPIQVPGLNLKGGLKYAGVGGNGRGAFQRDWNNIAPRAGFAYRWNDKTVLRGGYGLMYAQVFDDPGGAPGFSQTTRMVTSVETGIPFNTLTNPFPSGILTPVGNSQGLQTFVGQSFNFSNPNRELPYTHQFSFEIQRELPFRLLMTAGYVGSRIRKLSVNKPFNEISLDSLNRGTAFLSASVPNPMFGYVPGGTSISNPTTTNQQLLRPYPQFLNITELNRSEGRARYDGFQFLLSRRFSKGLTASASYTYSRTLEWLSYRNAQDKDLEKTVASWDVPQSLQLNGVWELPFGRGRAFVTNAPKYLGGFLSGWEISGIARIQSGMPLTLNGNTVPTGVSPVYAGQSLDRWFNTCTQLANGTTANCLTGESPAWSVRPANTLQNWSTRITSVRTLGIRNVDFALMKRTPITERVTLTIRGELMNATNTPQFYNGPSTDVNNGNFGRISGALNQSNLPRFGQLSMKLQF